MSLTIITIVTIIAIIIIITVVVLLAPRPCPMLPGSLPGRCGLTWGTAPAPAPLTDWKTEQKKPTQRALERREICFPSQH